MTTLTISRPLEVVGAARRTLVFIDGRQVAALRPRGTCQVELVPGQHVLTTKQGFAASRPLILDIGTVDQAVQVWYPLATGLAVFRPKTQIKTARIA